MPSKLSLRLRTFLLLNSLVITGVTAGNITNYANAFVDPKFILNKSAWNPDSTFAEAAIVSAAQTFVTEGPWAVTNKSVLPPSNNTHDYLSYAPYFWPDCSKVHNTTQLTQQQINNECTYGMY